MAGLFVVLLAAFAAGIWGTVVRPPAYEVVGIVVARPARDQLLVRHEAVSGLGMGAMEMMAVQAEPSLLDAVDPRAGERLRLAVRRRGDDVLAFRIERIR